MVLGAVVLLSMSGVELDWRAPPSCPAPTLSSLSAHLAGSVEVDVVTEEVQRWSVALHFTAPFRALRELEVGSCEEARRVVLALIELGLKAAQTAAAPVSVAPTLPIESEPPELPTTPHGPWVVGLGAAMNVASSPGTTTRFTLSGGLRFDSFEADLVARTGIPITSAGPVAIEWWPVLGGELLGCWVPSSGRLRFGICAGALAEWWRQTGPWMLFFPRRDEALVAIGGGFRVSVSLVAGVELGLSFAARVHVVRPVVTFDTLSSAASPASVEVGGFVGWGAEPTESRAPGHSRPE